MSTSCVVHMETLLAVKALTKEGALNRLTLGALEAVLEALVLYDELIVHENFPGRLMIELASEEDNLYGYDAPEDQPLPFLYRMYKEKCLDWGDAISPETRERIVPDDFSFASYESKTGQSMTPIAVRVPSWLADRARTQPVAEVEPIVRKSLELMQWTGLPERLVPEDSTRFIQEFAAAQTHDLDCVRALSDSKKADALLITTPAKPFFGVEQEALRSAVHQQFLKVEEELTKAVFAPGVTFDHTPLLAVALDTTLRREDLVQTMFQMRQDYSELRTVGRDYKAQLGAAASYGARMEAIRDWNRAWEIILAKIGKPQKGLLGQIFSWDVIKKGTVKGALLESADKVKNAAQELLVAGNLRVVHHFAEEFEFARPIEKRIEELFGGLDTSDWSPWRVMTLF